jgi:hypothetical protein
MIPLEEILMLALDCGCVVCGQAVSYCARHSERDPPAGLVPGRSRAETAAAAPHPPAPAAPRFGRRRLDPDTGELED